MSLLLMLLVLCSTFNTHTKANRHHKPAVVVGSVYCETCFEDGFLKDRHSLPGAHVSVICRLVNSKLLFMANVRTNTNGTFKVNLPFSVTKHVRNIKRCAVTVEKTSEPNCYVAAKPIVAKSLTYLNVSLDHKTLIFSSGLFSFRPYRQSNYCQKNLKIGGEVTLDPQFSSPPPLLLAPTTSPVVQEPKVVPKFISPIPFLPFLPPLPQLPPLPPLPILPGMPPLLGYAPEFSTRHSVSHKKDPDYPDGLGKKTLETPFSDKKTVGNPVSSKKTQATLFPSGKEKIEEAQVLHKKEQGAQFSDTKIPESPLLSVEKTKENTKETTFPFKNEQETEISDNKEPKTHNLSDKNKQETPFSAEKTQEPKTSPSLDNKAQETKASDKKEQNQDKKTRVHTEFYLPPVLPWNPFQSPTTSVFPPNLFGAPSIPTPQQNPFQSTPAPPNVLEFPPPSPMFSAPFMLLPPAPPAFPLRPLPALPPFLPFPSAPDIPGISSTTQP